MNQTNAHNQHNYLHLNRNQIFQKKIELLSVTKFFEYLLLQLDKHINRRMTI